MKWLFLFFIIFFTPTLLLSYDKSYIKTAWQIELPISEFCSDKKKRQQIMDLDYLEILLNLLSGIDLKLAIDAMCSSGAESLLDISVNEDTDEQYASFIFLLNKNNCDYRLTAKHGSSTISRNCETPSKRSPTPFFKCSKFVSFDFDGPGFEYSSNLQLSVPSGQYVNGNGTSNISVGADSGCIGGTYNFSYTNNATLLGTNKDMRTYSGKFSVPSSASHCYVTISDGFGVDLSVSCD